MREIVVIAHDIRSTHNVGSLLRTADGLGVRSVYFTGYTPYPSEPNDTRLPHITAKITKDIHKTALGAETSVNWQHGDIQTVLPYIKAQGYQIIALEQAPHSVPLPDFVPPDKIAILIGREVEGIDSHLIAQCDTIVEIPMFGAKESFNVIQATAILLAHCRFHR